MENYWDMVEKQYRYPSCDPDFTPLDYHLFQNLQNSLNSKTFTNDNNLKSLLVQFFANKDQKFYQHGIMKLPERWQKIITNKMENIYN